MNLRNLYLDTLSVQAYKPLFSVRYLIGKTSEFSTRNVVFWRFVIGKTCCWCFSFLLFNRITMIDFEYVKCCRICWEFLFNYFHSLKQVSKSKWYSIQMFPFQTLPLLSNFFVQKNHLKLAISFIDTVLFEKSWLEANIRKPLVLWSSVSTNDTPSFHEFSWKFVELQFKVLISAE